MTTNIIPTREEINKDDTWDLEDIYATEQDWHIDFKKLESLIEEIKRFDGTLGQGAERLVNYYKAEEDLMLIAGHLMVYASVKFFS